MGSLRGRITNSNAIPLNTDVIIDLAPIQLAAMPAPAVIEVTTGTMSISRRVIIRASTSMPRPIIRRTQAFGGLFSVGTVDGVIEIEHLRFENGNSSNVGGAISYSQGGGPAAAMLVKGCEFFGNIAGFEIIANRQASARGGAIDFVASAGEPIVSSLTVENCVFESNRALASSNASGSAIRAENAMVEITDSIFRGNQCEGATSANAAVTIEGSRAPAVIRRSLFANNTSNASMSALQLSTFSVPGGDWSDEITDCTFLNNQGVGAAMAISTTTGTIPVLMRNCTFAGNSGDMASAISLFRTTLNMHHATIANNIHQNINGGAVNLPSGSQSTLNISRSAVAGNRQTTNIIGLNYSKDISSLGTVTSIGANFIGSATGLTGVFTQPDDLAGTNAAPIEPLLATPGNYGGPVPTMPPLPESPLVDGIPTAFSSFVPLDVRGVGRPQGTRGDIGAVELPRLAYNTWHLQIIDPKDRGSSLDPDGDGLTNLLEYLFGTDPNSASPSPVRMVETDTGLYIEVIRSSLIRPALFSTIRLDASTTLRNDAPNPGAWAPAGIQPIVTPEIEGSIESLRYRYPVNPNPAGREFFRMVAID